MRYILYLTLFMLSGNLFSQQSNLTALGPDGGIITFLKGSLSDDVVFSVVQGKELYRSANGGESWNKVVVPIVSSNSYDINSVTLHPYSSDTVFVTTSAGLLRSNDKGISWMLNSNLPYPKNNVVYALGNPNVIFGSDNAGVLRSNDGGKTWQPLKDNIYFGNRPIYKIAVHPFDNINFRVIVSTGFNDTAGLFYTSNSGQNWKPLNKGLLSEGSRRIYSLEFDTTGMGKLNFRAIAGTAAGLYGMQTDQSDSLWQSLKMNTIDSLGVVTGGAVVYDRYDPTLFNPITQTNGQHLFSLYIAVNSSEFEGKVRPTTLQNGLFKIDSRFSTIAISPPVRRVFGGVGDIMSVFIPLTKSKGKIYIGTTSGVFVSLDSGQTWNAKNSGIQRALVRNVATLSPSQSTSTLFAGVYGGGVYRSTNDGTVWTTINSGLTNTYVTTIISDKRKNYVYAGTPYTLYRSTNNGAVWNAVFQVDTSIIINKERFSIRDNEMTVRVSPKNSDIVIFHARAYGVFITKDGAKSWGRIIPPPGSDSIFIPEHLQFDPVDSTTIYYSGNGLHKSTNLGQSWENISGNLPKSNLVPVLNSEVGLSYLSPTINPNNTKEIFLSAAYNLEKGLPFKLFKTSNGGMEWIPTDISSYGTVYDIYDDQSIIASGPKGIYRSVNSGASWARFSDSLSSQQYFLASANPNNQNIFYFGSESGAYKLDFNEFPKLSIDTTEYNFGSVRTGVETTQTIYFKNTNGTKKLILQFLSLGDTIAFKYLSSRRIEVPIGDSVSVEVKYSSFTSGTRSTLLRFESNDPERQNVNFTLRGHSYSGEVLNGFIHDFGSVTLGNDSTLSIIIDNSQRLKNFTFTYLTSTGDTSSFVYAGPNIIIVDSGKTTSFAVNFIPKSVGEKILYLRFSTSDPKFPVVLYRFKGVGVARNFISRRILIETSNGFAGDSGSSMIDLYKYLSASLRRADMVVHTQKSAMLSTYNSVLYVSPTTPFSPSVIDSLQQYVVNGGFLVLIGDINIDANNILTSFLEDSSWKKKYNITTGIRFNTNVIFDSTQTFQSQMGTIVAKPLKSNSYTYNVDSISTFITGTLTLDTTQFHVIPLFGTSSNGLYSFNFSDSSISKIPRSVFAAASLIGKGKIISISDQDIWQNGIAEDTTNVFGIFAANNLQFALNTFGLVDNLAARLPEATPQEAYTMFSIPYSFADSSVEALFKDLGPPNKVLWRMFGKYNQRTGYAEFPEDFKSVRRGEGYWIITKDKKNITFGTTTVQGTEDDFEIVLHPGYNMIGNPFPYDVSWKDSFIPDSVEKVIWSFDKGNYDSVTQTMEKFRGYWIKNNGNLPKVIKVNSAQLSSTLRKGNDEVPNLAADEWKIQIVASTKSTSDKNTYLGSLASSVDGLDENDFSKPPVTPSKYISVYSKHPNSHLAADYRSISKTGHFWDFELISSEANAQINLLLKKSGSLPTNFNVFILDNKQERVYDIGHLMQYAVNLEKGEKSRSFRIIVGTLEFAEENTNGIPFIPLEYSLSQNFPNPFNPTTSIQYTLSHSAETKLEIFNILGQKVRTLVNEFQKIGTYSIFWDGTDESGKGISSGVYYYRLKANSFSSVKKMTFVK